MAHHATEPVANSKPRPSTEMASGSETATLAYVRRPICRARTDDRPAPVPRGRLWLATLHLHRHDQDLATDHGAALGHMPDALAVERSPSAR